MGTFLSSLVGGGGAEESGYSTEPSLVTAFHSSHEWQEHLDACKKFPILMVVDFTATWSGPCRLFAPLFKDMAAKFPNAKFIKIDVDELSDVAQQFGVQAMPTFLLLKRGEEVGRVVGANKDELEKKIELQYPHASA